MNNKEVSMYCEDCGKEIDKLTWVELKYDDAMAAEDGYGNYWSVYLCRECAYREVAIPGETFYPHLKKGL